MFGNKRRYYASFNCQVTILTIMTYNSNQLPDIIIYFPATLQGWDIFKFLVIQSHDNISGDLFISHAVNSFLECFICKHFTGSLCKTIFT